MPIRLRLAVAFAADAAALFALGGWLFASGLSSAQLNTIDSQPTVQVAQAGRYLTPAGNAPGAGASAAAGLPPGDYVIQVLDAAAGLGAYWLALAALSPVERLRQQVAAVSVGSVNVTCRSAVR